MSGGLRRYGVELKPRYPNFGAAIVHDSAGLLVGSVVTAGKVTDLVIDTTKVGHLFLEVLLKGPANVVYPGGADWTTPRTRMKMLTPPAATSGVRVLCGVKDGPGVPVVLPATATVPAASGEQWYGLGFSYQAAPGPLASSASHNIAASDNTPAVASGIFATSEGSFTPDITGVGPAGFGRHFRVIVQAALDSGVGTAQQIDIVKTYKYAPRVVLVFISDGTGGDAAMPISLEACYKAQMA